VRAVVQRVKSASVSIEEQIEGEIGKGLLVYLGIEQGDDLKDVNYLAEKICNLRIFEDEDEKMNRSLLDEQGSILAISQFTLLGDCRKGRRPSFSNAKNPEAANHLYEKFVGRCAELGVPMETGVFQAHMMVSSTNDGPVTMLLDSKKAF
jgi:D-aminoacyl-tRNA deacylase